MSMPTLCSVTLSCCQIGIVREGQVRFVVFVIRVVRHARDATGTGSPAFGGRSASSAT